MSKYAAFISYRHDGIDGKIAVRLQKEIENFRIPKKLAARVGRKTIGKVFRDEDELRAASDLSEVIREAIDESEWLIVVCTPGYKDSPWCMEELTYFIETHSRDRIIVVLADGEPEDSFPHELTHIPTGDGEDDFIITEPLAVDVRDESEKAVIKNVTSERFRYISSLLDVSFDDLRQRQRERRIRRLVAIFSFVFIVLAGIIGVITAKNIELNDAYTALDNSNRETLRSESYYLSEYSDAAYVNGDTKTALMLSMEALPKDLENPDRPFVSQAMASLTQALGVYDYTQGYKAGAFFNEDADTYDLRTILSDDGGRVLIEKYTAAAGNMLNREVKVCALPQGDVLCSYTLSPVSRTYDHSDALGSYLTGDGKTLYYLSEDGLKGVEVDSGAELFSAETASEIKVGSGEKVIISIDYESGKLRSYDNKGNNTINCEIGNEMNYTLGEISPDEKQVSLAANTEYNFGIITIALSNGESAFYDMPGECSYVNYTDNNRLCFLLKDSSDTLKHIVQYDTENGDQRYLSNTDWDLTTMTLTDDQTCYYYRNNKLIEIDCNSKEGKNIWSHVFSSDILSVKAGGGVLAVSCRDGSVSFYEEKDKRLINTQAGNGEPYYLMNVNDKNATLRDYWGRSLRVYTRADNKSRDALDSSVITNTIPKKWYTSPSDYNKFLIGFHDTSGDSINILDSSFNSVSKSLDSLNISSFSNKAFDIKNSEYIEITDYDDQKISHYSTSDLSKLDEYDEVAYNIYDETGETLFIAEKNKLIERRIATGKDVSSSAIPTGYNRGVKIGDTYVWGSDSEILIGEAKSGKVLKNAVLYGMNSARGLIIYRTPDEKKWYVYSIAENKVLCEGASGAYSCTIFFGNNRYFLNDYNSVYDMNTWKKVLDLSSLGTSIYGVQTTDDIPYFVVWCQENESNSGGRAAGSSVAYLYDKSGDGNIVGRIPNYVSLTTDGKIIVYDGEYTLYKLPLLTGAELMERARTEVAGSRFTAYQKEKYHLFD